jgi:hypothetical protein
LIGLFTPLDTLLSMLCHFSHPQRSIRFWSFGVETPSIRALADSSSGDHSHNPCPWSPGQVKVLPEDDHGNLVLTFADVFSGPEYAKAYLWAASKTCNKLQK